MSSRYINELEESTKCFKMRGHEARLWSKTMKWPTWCTSMTSLFFYMFDSRWCEVFPQLETLWCQVYCSQSDMHDLKLIRLLMKLEEEDFHKVIWQRLLRIFANYFTPLVFTWGMVVWTSLARDEFHYDTESMDHGFYTKNGSLRTLPLMSLQF